MQKTPLKITFALALGSGLEYYDFVIFGLMIKYTSAIFYPQSGLYSGIFQILITFAAGYFVRPLGGLIFGLIADIYGRSKAFIAAMLLMALSTFSIGLLPTFEQCGVIAPILLIICRMLQGISFGAELPGAITILSENAEVSKLGKLCSFILSGTTIGSLMAMMIVTIISNKYSPQIINDYAWRLPFLLGGVLAIISFFIRKNIANNTDFFKDSNQQSMNLVFSELKRNFTYILIGSGIIFFMATLIITNLYFPVYISRNFTHQLPQIFVAMTNSMIASIIFMLFWGFVSDYISKIKQLIFAVIGFNLSLFPLYYLLQDGAFITLQLSFIIYQFWIAVFVSSCLPIISQLFPSSIRYTGTALIYNIAFCAASLIPAYYEYLFATENAANLGYFFTGSGFIALASVMYLMIIRRIEISNA